MDDGGKKKEQRRRLLEIWKSRFPEKWNICGIGFAWGNVNMGSVNELGIGAKDFENYKMSR